MAGAEAVPLELHEAAVGRVVPRDFGPAEFVVAAEQAHLVGRASQRRVVAAVLFDRVFQE